MTNGYPKAKKISKNCFKCKWVIKDLMARNGRGFTVRQNRYLTLSWLLLSAESTDIIDNLRLNLGVVPHIPAKSCDCQYLSIILANQLTIIEYYRVISSNRLVSDDRFLSICNAPREVCFSTEWATSVRGNVNMYSVSTCLSWVACSRHSSCHM